jgi:hypothetical protein
MASLSPFLRAFHQPLALRPRRPTPLAIDSGFYAEHPRSRDRLPVLAQWPDMVAAKLKFAGLARAGIGVEAAGGLHGRAVALLPGASLVPVLGHRQIRLRCKRGTMTRAPRMLT